jgi:low affinity Fe/Cu permease
MSLAFGDETDDPTAARREPGLNTFSRAVHGVDRGTSRPASAVVVTALVIGFGVALAVARFPTSWETAFAAACAAVTTIMVFVIQHTQKREQAATQLKLDELIRALPGADDHLVKVEAADDAELAEIGQAHFEHHRSVRADD